MRKRRQRSIPREYRSPRCVVTGKLRYSADDALSAIESAYDRKYEKLSGYKCRHCLDWHLTCTPFNKHIWYSGNVRSEMEEALC